MIVRSLLWMVPLSPVSALSQWVWMPPEQYLKESTLIAILDVGEIHQAWTSENILIESASATVEKVVYYQFAQEEKLPATIVVYTVDPNAMIFEGHGYHTGTPMFLLEKGRVFAMLKMRGVNKFVPFDRFSFESLATNKILWPTAFGKDDRLLPVERVIDDLERIEGTMKAK
jgi:hypothetical protein